MKPHVFLKSAELPGANPPHERALNDFVRAGGWAPFGLRIPNAALMTPAQGMPGLAPKRRTKLWELTAMLHCSIIGTCLMSGELRSLLRRCGAVADNGSSDHELHKIAVSAAGQHDAIAKEMHKTLDQRHRSALARFSGAANAAELRRLWDEAIQGGDIPGAYWALLTHPLCDDELARHAFGDIHMLS